MATLKQTCDLLADFILQSDITSGVARVYPPDRKHIEETSVLKAEPAVCINFNSPHTSWLQLKKLA